MVNKKNIKCPSDILYIHWMKKIDKKIQFFKSIIKLSWIQKTTCALTECFFNDIMLYISVRNASKGTHFNFAVYYTNSFLASQILLPYRSKKILHWFSQPNTLCGFLQFWLRIGDCLFFSSNPLSCCIKMRVRLIGAWAHE